MPYKDPEKRRELSRRKYWLIKNDPIKYAKYRERINTWRKAHRAKVKIMDKWQAKSKESMHKILRNRT
jgi:hypothetical protein